MGFFLSLTAGLLIFLGVDAVNEAIQLAAQVGIVYGIDETQPHCPGAVRSANQLALASALVTVSIADVQVHSSLAERFNVRSVPLTILDGELAVHGVVPPADLVDKILSCGDEDHGRNLLLSLVEQGRFDEAAGRIGTLFADRRDADDRSRPPWAWGRDWEARMPG